MKKALTKRPVKANLMPLVKPVLQKFQELKALRGRNETREDAASIGNLNAQLGQAANAAKKGKISQAKISSLKSMVFAQMGKEKNRKKQPQVIVQDEIDFSTEELAILAAVELMVVNGVDLDEVQIDDIRDNLELEMNLEQVEDNIWSLAEKLEVTDELDEIEMKMDDQPDDNADMAKEITAEVEEEQELSEDSGLVYDEAAYSFAVPGEENTVAVTTVQPAKGQASLPGDDQARFQVLAEKFAALRDEEILAQDKAIPLFKPAIALGMAA